MKAAKASFDTQNKQCAATILQAPDHHGGEQSLEVRWARLFMQRSTAKPQHQPVSRGTSRPAA